ncbi:tumor necrosis factor ligand superfamily member 13B isoform X4 [Electrophorus electricus]|uniref:tumor necrosis factor ligand superfamily member 13B isoform X4 n=1 Tax=Electrophorus electricus TaxID=8005 RepID=UPI0015D06E3C|nr:tumor necrosis factor ligand superfamily member 13B isoform X4 [Electrophorus electricus]
MSAEGASRCRAERRRLSCALTVLTLAAITSSSLSALSLYRALALQAEVEVLRTEVNRRREAQGGVAGGGVGEPQRAAEEDREDAETPWWARSAAPPEDRSEPSLKKRSLGREPAQTVFQPCLQMMADSRRKPYQKEFALDVHVAVPWQTGLKRGTALEGDQDDILVREEGYYFIYSQVEHYDQPEVFYKDPKYAMGHIVLRTKQNVVGDESQHVVLFRCVQSMNAKVPYNTCFTGGIVKLESGDRVELLIPRSTANISLDGDSTFLGAVKLA